MSKVRDTLKKFKLMRKVAQESELAFKTPKKMKLLSKLWQVSIKDPDYSIVVQQDGYTFDEYCEDLIRMEMCGLGWLDDRYIPVCVLSFVEPLSYFLERKGQEFETKEDVVHLGFDAYNELLKVMRPNEARYD